MWFVIRKSGKHPQIWQYPPNQIDNGRRTYINWGPYYDSVSIATTERYFSAMKIIKNKLRNKMNVEFLTSSMIIYIERDIVTSFNSDSII